MKKCPFCAEEIQDDAIKCKHCGEFLEPRPVKTKTLWYYSNATIIVGFFCVGPLILPLVLINPRYSPATKVVITAVMLLLTWFLGKLAALSFGYLKDFYSLI